MKGRERKREESFLRARYRQETKEREREERKREERWGKRGEEEEGKKSRGLSATECLPAEERLEKTTRWLQSHRRCFCFPRWEAAAGHWEARSKKPRTKKRAAMSGRRRPKKRTRQERRPRKLKGRGFGPRFVLSRGTMSARIRRKRGLTARPH